MAPPGDAKGWGELSFNLPRSGSRGGAAGLDSGGERAVTPLLLPPKHQFLTRKQDCRSSRNPSQWNSDRSAGADVTPAASAACQRGTRIMIRGKRLLLELYREDSGQDVLEYALIGAFTILVAIAAVQGVGNALVNQWNNISSVVSDAAAGN